MKIMPLSFFIIVCVFATGFTQETPTLTVFDFISTSLSKNELRSVASFFSMSFYRTDMFTVIDPRERDARLEKARARIAACDDDACFIRAAKLIPLEYIVTGDISKKDGRFFFRSRLLSVKTGATIRSSESTYPSMTGMLDDLNSVARKLAQGPLDAGTVQPDRTLPPEITTPEPVATPENPAETAPPTEETSRSETLETPGPDPDSTTSDGEPDASTSIVPQKKTFAIGVMGGWTLPIGNVGTIMGWTITGTGYVRYLIPFDANELAIGLSGGFQIETTTDIFPIPYEMITIPALADVRYRFGIFPGLFYVEAGAGIGASINLVNYKGDTMKDLIVVKAMGSATVSAGFDFGFAGVYLFDSFSVIMFDTNPYLANSAGVGIELRL